MGVLTLCGCMCMGKCGPGVVRCTRVHESARCVFGWISISAKYVRACSQTCVCRCACHLLCPQGHRSVLFACLRVLLVMRIEESLSPQINASFKVGVDVGWWPAGYIDRFAKCVSAPPACRQWSHLRTWTPGSGDVTSLDRGCVTLPRALGGHGVENK